MYSLLSILTTALLAAAAPFADATCDQRISKLRQAKAESAYRKAKIISGVVAPSWKPTLDVIPSYGDQIINFGTVTSTAETVKALTIRFTPKDGHDAVRTNYTVLLVDPDAPSPKLPSLHFFLHEILYDAHPICTGIEVKTKTPYLALTPLSLAKHRYIFLVYRQPAGTFVPQIPVLPQAGRAMLDLAKFVKDNKLTGPISGNYVLQGLDSTAS